MKRSLRKPAAGVVAQEPPPQKRPRSSLLPPMHQLVRDEYNKDLWKVDGGLLLDTEYAPHDIVLGIDPSLTGFAMCALHPEGQYQFWLIRSSKRGVDRLADIQNQLSMVMTKLSIRRFTFVSVCMEGYSFGAQNNREVLGELGGVVKVTLRSALQRNHPEGAYPTIVQPTALKKFVTGTGSAKKSEMLKAVYKRWGIDVADDNLADAYGLARMSLAVAFGSEKLTKEQQAVVSSLHICTERDGVPGT